MKGPMISALITLLVLWRPVSWANTRTLESPFALSADARSEFAMTFTTFSAGRIVIEATWNTHQASPHPLRILLLRPDGIEAAQRAGTSPLRLEYSLTERESEEFNKDSLSKWQAKVVNSVSATGNEASGKLRVTIPVSTRTIEDSQFTLLGQGNAQEIGVRLPTAGRVTVDAEWLTDPWARDETARLTLSLEHPGSAKIYARRTLSSPLRIEQQITEADLDRGSRIVIRLQNDGTVRVKGRVKVTLAPAV